MRVCTEWIEQPIRRVHETIEAASLLLNGDEPVSYDGELVSIADVPPLETEVPIYHAALGPANRRVVARVADGWIPHNLPFSELPAAADYISKYASEAGRSLDDITDTPYVPSAVSEDPEVARNAIAGHLAYYVGSGTGYQRAVATQFESEAETISALWNDGEHGEAAEAVTGDMIEALGVAGNPAQAREQFREIKSMDIVDDVILMIPNPAPELADKTIRALAPENL